MDIMPILFPTLWCAADIWINYDVGTFSFYKRIPESSMYWHFYGTGRKGSLYSVVVIDCVKQILRIGFEKDQLLVKPIFQHMLRANFERNVFKVAEHSFQVPMPNSP